MEVTADPTRRIVPPLRPGSNRRATRSDVARGVERLDIPKAYTEVQTTITIFPGLDVWLPRMLGFLRT